MQIIPARDRFIANHGWLKSAHLFSFADYYDPANMSFGALRVFNDDYIEAGHGFPPHQHANYEIVTVVLEGAVTHEDSLGNRGQVRAGEVQSMTAGTGVTHAEGNHKATSLHLYQIWLQPTSHNLKPEYHQVETSFDGKENALIAVASNIASDNVAHINADATIYRLALTAGHSLDYTLKPGRGLFIYVTAGQLTINDQPIGPLDQARVTSTDHLTLKSSTDSKLILIDVAL